MESENEEKVAKMKKELAVKIEMQERNIVFFESQLDFLQEYISLENNSFNDV